MTRVTTGLIVLAGLITLGAADAQAGSAHRQRVRIADGAEGGSLTRREARGLVREQLHIRREAYRYLNNDGHLGPWERLDLARDLARANRHIYRQKHDGQTR